MKKSRVTTKKKKFLFSIFAGNLIVVVVSSILLSLLINQVLHQYVINDIAQKDKMMLSSMKQNLDVFLQDAVDTLAMIEMMAGIKTGSELNEKIEQINNIRGYYENIEVLNDRGIVINTLPQNARQVYDNRSGEEFFQSLSRQESGLYWSMPSIPPTGSEPTVTVAMRKDNRYIVGFLNLEYVGTLVSKFAKMDKDLKTSVVDGYGIHISSYDMDLVRQRQIEPHFGLIAESRISEAPYEFLRTSEYLGFSVKTESPGWYVIIYDDYKRSMAIMDNLIYLFLILFTASIGLFMIVSFFRSYRLNKYIDQFISQTEHIAAGEFDTKMPDQKYQEFERLSASFRAMTEHLKGRDQKLEFMGYHDSLTSLYNRAYLYSYRWQERFQHEGYGLIFLDVDNFKNINDTHGHNVGDQLLVEVSRRIEACLTENSIVFRFGGDEFVIIISEKQNLQRMAETIERITESFKSPVEIDLHRFFVTVSMGGTFAELQEYDLNQMLKAADIAMYQVKANGKNHFRLYNPEMDAEVKKRLQIEQNLRSALEKKELSIVYQPQLYGKSRKVRGFEALLRWDCQALGSVPPLDFIPIAEETGMIIEMGEWVLENACRAIKNINESKGAHYVMAVNISPIQLSHPDFIDNLYKMMEMVGIEKEWLEIEITENVLLANVEDAISKIESLVSNGISVSLDDFGTGYSSLSYLSKLPVKTLKIDSSFIHGLSSDINCNNMVISIILLAHKMGVFLVAEGVEDQRQADILNDYDCDCLQGFLFSRPLSLEQVKDYLNQTS